MEEIEKNYNREIEAPTTTRVDEINESYPTNPKLHPRTLEKAKNSILNFIRDAEHPKARSMYKVFCHCENRFNTNAICVALKELVLEDKIRCKRNDVIGGGLHVDHWFTFNPYPKTKLNDDA